MGRSGNSAVDLQRSILAQNLQQLSSASATGRRPRMRLSDVLQPEAILSSGILSDPNGKLSHVYSSPCITLCSGR